MTIYVILHTLFLQVFLPKPLSHSTLGSHPLNLHHYIVGHASLVFIRFIISGKHLCFVHRYSHTFYSRLLPLEFTLFPMNKVSDLSTLVLIPLVFTWHSFRQTNRSFRFDKEKWRWEQVVFTLKLRALRLTFSELIALLQHLNNSPSVFSTTSMWSYINLIYVNLNSIFLIKEGRHRKLYK